MTNGQRATRARHIEHVLANAKLYTLKEIQDLALGTLEELQGYVPRPTLNDFSLSAADWSLSSVELSEFVYVANISVSGLTANDYAEINFNRASQSLVADANICASAETDTDCLRLYSENIPESTIRGQFVVFKGGN